MANKKFVDLPALTTMTDATIVPTSDGTTTKKITGANLKTYFLNGTATLTGEETLTNKTLTSPSITGGVFEGTFSIGNQIFYAHGYNGFSVNEDWDIVGESNFTGYHYTSGAGRDGVAFTLARTGQFTNGFGIHGTAGANEYVIGSETANTDFVFKKSVGMPFDVSGGTEIFRISKTGVLTVVQGGTTKTVATESFVTDQGYLTSTSTSSITANNATAFIAGTNAISNVALSMPRESALRNSYNGDNAMYFDVSNGGTTHGSFQFRSTSSFTNILTLKHPVTTFNADIAIVGQTASISKTSFNAAIDTEITAGNFRFRISNSGGVFPQVIGNGSSVNAAWTCVAALSGAAVAQAGSTGTIVSSSVWSTMYNLHGMDAAGDTITATIQDKAAGRIYRITFMRSDNGSTTGYNIIAERLL